MNCKRSFGLIGKTTSIAAGKVSVIFLHLARLVARSGAQREKNRLILSRMAGKLSEREKNSQIFSRTAKPSVVLRYGIFLCPRHLDTLSVGIFPTDASAKYLKISRLRVADNRTKNSRQITVRSPVGIQPWRPSASSMFCQSPTVSIMRTLVPSCSTKRLTPLPGELLTSLTA